MRKKVWTALALLAILGVSGYLAITTLISCLEQW